METLVSELWLPQKRERVFSFFANAKNLQTITPPWLDFQIANAGPIEMKVGAYIQYRLKVHGIPLGWTSEITAWNPPSRFVDEQRNGPYRTWIHEHTFEEKDGGTLIRDNVQYAAPGGKLIEWLFVGREVKRIFDFRSKKLRELFGNS
ncbi:SRPBCC family protein [Pedosphaera parvula]|nr:SRPBCC family protein [Pedosphaera parvula]